MFGVLARKRGDPAIDEPLVRIDFGPWQSEFVGEHLSCRQDAVEYVAQLVVVTDQLEQRLPPGALPTDTEERFRRRIEGLDQQAAVNDDDRCVELIKEVDGRWGTAAGATFRYRGPAIEFCWT